MMEQSEASAARGRLAPSPTGRLHLGNAFAFLLAWLSARSRSGRIVLRMEDIDPDRSRPEYALAILEDLVWLGLDWDEGPDLSAARRGSPGSRGPCGPYVQSERLGAYAAILEEFEQRGLTYPCYCTRKELRLLASAPHVGDEGAPYPGTCRNLEAAARRRLEAAGRRPCIRLNTEKALAWLASSGFAAGTALDFDDAVLGPRRFSLADCGGDFALRRSDGVFAYQLAVVADDAAMRISEVVRGDDLLLSTPRQILLFRLLGRPVPGYAHLPLLHDEHGERLAKRHKALELAALRAQGLPPAAVVGFLGHLAGFLDRPGPAAPADLLKRFSLAALRGRRLDTGGIRALSI